MPRVAAVTIKNYKGNNTHATIDLKKNKEIIPPAVEKSQFDIDFENGISVEEALESSLKHLRSLPWKK